MVLYLGSLYLREKITAVNTKKSYYGHRDKQHHYIIIYYNHESRLEIYIPTCPTYIIYYKVSMVFKTRLILVLHDYQ